MVPSLGTAHSSWNRQALTAYTQLRTNKGPFGSWLHHINKRDSAECPYGHPIQDGHHITFNCPLHAEKRSALLLHRNTWLELDQQIYIQDSQDEEAYEATEEFFSYLASTFR